MGYIYLVTNLINNKKYVGQTTLTINERWKRHIYEAIYKLDDFYFHKAIKKYGVENFKVEELCSCNDNELDEKEIYYIEYYKTYYIYKKGYNLTRGGSGYTKVNKNEIMKLWDNGLSAIEIARVFGFYIRTITDVLKRNNVAQEEIYSRSQKYGARWRQKKIYQYNFNGELINVYDNLEEMHQLTGYRKDYISAACRHTYPAANGYLWIYEDEQASIQELLEKIPPTANHPVLQYSLDGKLIREYSSYGEAARALNLNKSFISKAVKQIGATAGGYFWKDKDNLENFTIEESIIKKNNRYNDRKKAVYQYDLNGNFIASYESLISAATAMGKPSCSSAIGKVCRGLQETSCGYRWSYVKP